MTTPNFPFLRSCHFFNHVDYLSVLDPVTDMNFAVLQKLQEKLMLALAEGGDPKLEDMLNQMQDHPHLLQPVSEVSL